MVFIVGGKAQGKLEYALNIYKGREQKNPAVCDGAVCTPEELRTRLEADIAAGCRQPDCIPRALERLESCRRLPAAWQRDTTGLSPARIADRLLADTLENR